MAVHSMCQPGQIVWDAKIDPDKKIEKSVGIIKEETPAPPVGANK